MDGKGIGTNLINTRRCSWYNVQRKLIRPGKDNLIYSYPKHMGKLGRTMHRTSFHVKVKINKQV